jgi:hypothetical protein
MLPQIIQYLGLVYHLHEQLYMCYCPNCIAQHTYAYYPGGKVLHLTMPRIGMAQVQQKRKYD